MGLEPSQRSRPVRLEGSVCVFGRVFLLTIVLWPVKTDAAVLPTGFHRSIVCSRQTQPTAVRFAANHRVLGAENSRLIKVF